MNDELKAAIEWAQGIDICAEGNRHIRVLADAAERSMGPRTVWIEYDGSNPPTDTTKWLASEWQNDQRFIWVRWFTENKRWTGLLRYTYVDPPKPKPELRCPWPGCDGWLFANTDDRTWWMQCDTCKCPGPIRANEADARASAEVRR